MSKLKALVIDEEAEFRDVARMMLEPAGFEVELVSAGFKGLEHARQQRFDLVCCSNNLLDIAASDFCGQLRAINGYDFVSVLILTDVDDSKILKQFRPSRLAWYIAISAFFTNSLASFAISG